MQNRQTKNILVFQHDAALYGASQSLLTVLEHLVKNKDLQILVLLPYSGLLEERLTALGVHYKVIPFPRCIVKQPNSLKQKFVVARKYLRDEFKWITALTEIGREFEPDIIYSNTSVVSIGFRLSRVFGIPHVWHIREFGDIDFNFRYLPLRAVVKRRVLKSEKLIFASNALMFHWVGASADKFSVVYNGVVAKDQKIMPLKKPVGGRWKFGIIGAVMPAKGQDVAILAFSKLLHFYPDCELHVYGGTGNKMFMHNLESELRGMDDNKKVFFHDFVADNRSIYGAIDVVLSCAVNEAFGRTVVEAMSHGVPVIANASGGPLEIIEDGKSGLLYNASAEDLFKKMQLLMTDDHLYNVISERAITIAQKRFNVEQYVGSVEGIIMEAIART